jgi:hypothetical protein
MTFLSLNIKEAFCFVVVFFYWLSLDGKKMGSLHDLKCGLRAYG